MELLRDFKQINKGDARLAGGKGASLGEMAQAGIPVPPGFVLLASAFNRFIEETDLNVEIDAILHTVDHRDIHTVDAASEKIQALILDTKMPEDIADAIMKSYKKLCAKPAPTSGVTTGTPGASGYVAVRSSATAEDSASAAWAGQLDTF